MSRLTIGRRGWALIAGAAVISFVGLAGLGYGLGYIGGSSFVGTAPRFIDQAASAGLNHVYDGDASYDVGGGVAVFDCDDDGFADVYLAGGANAAALYRNDSTVGGDLAFTKLSDPTTDLTGVQGAYPIDIDGDGEVDLAVLRLGETQLLRGLGGCRFERANERWAFDGGDAYSTSFSATWEGTNQLPTLAVGRYLKVDAAGKPTLDCDQSELLRPKADGTGFGEPIPLPPGYCTLSMLFSDWDRSGRRDLRMTNDRNYYIGGEDQLWRIAPGETPRPYTDEDGWVSVRIFGMGIASYDVNDDTYPDYYLTSQADNRLQILTVGPEQPTFRDIAYRRGLTAAQPFTGGDVLPSTAWHPEFQDVNNDGLIDLFISKGNVSTQPDYASKDPSNLLLGQPDRMFKEAGDTAGILNFDRARGAALADFNLDGLLDLVEVNYGAPARLWLNAGSSGSGEPSPMGHWLAVRPSQDGGNRDAIGAWIEVKAGETTMRRELTIGGGHAGGQLGWIHFGLGDQTSAEVRVLWPDGEAGPWMAAQADRFFLIGRGSSSPGEWTPPNP
jgi:enediyne biosynthesis protein E4